MRPIVWALQFTPMRITNSLESTFDLWYDTDIYRWFQQKIQFASLTRRCTMFPSPFYFSLHITTLWPCAAHHMSHWLPLSTMLDLHQQLWKAPQRCPTACACVIACVSGVTWLRHRKTGKQRIRLFLLVTLPRLSQMAVIRSAYRCLYVNTAVGISVWSGTMGLGNNKK